MASKPSLSVFASHSADHAFDEGVRACERDRDWGQIPTEVDAGTLMRKTKCEARKDQGVRKCNWEMEWVKWGHRSESLASSTEWFWYEQAGLKQISWIQFGSYNSYCSIKYLCISPVLFTVVELVTVAVKLSPTIRAGLTGHLGYNTVVDD